MEFSLIQAMSLLLCFLITLFFYFRTTAKTRKSSNNQGLLPPGPPRLPLVGNVFQLGLNPHRSLAAFSKTYGPVMSLKLGKLTTLVISSPEAAREALKTHDHAFSARAFNDPLRALDHHKHSIVWIPPSAHWRFLRKTLTDTLLSPQHIDTVTQPLRKSTSEELLSVVSQFCERGEAIDLARASFVTTFNIMSNALFSTNLANYYSNSSSFDFHDTVVRLMKISGKPNVGDYFMFMRFLDLQGIRKEAGICIERLFGVFQEFIDARMTQRLSRKETKTKESPSIDLLDSLLDLTQHKTEFAVVDIKHMLMDLFIAGTDTNSSTIEWAMAELMRNPEKMVKAQREIREVIGENGVVQESDIPRLSYLQAILKETLRLHPASPLIPRKSESDVHMYGFFVPKDTHVFVNAWAIGRDPNVWENPMKFEPERFLVGEIDVKGKDFELLPFGSGRRMCPGITMAFKTMSMVLGSLLYSFDWKLPNGVGTVDMDEAFGLTLHRAKALCLVPIKKHI